MIDAIIVPQGAEYQAVKKGLNKVSIQSPLLISIPIGIKQIATALSKENFWRFQPKTVLMIGLCGSLSSRYSVGDTVLYQACYSQQTGTKIATDRKLNQLITKQLMLSYSQEQISLAVGITSDRVITKIAEKRQLARDFEVDIVDMESFAYLELLQQQKVAVSVLRIVSDDLNHSLPNLETAISESGNLKPLAIAKAIIKQPLASAHLVNGSLKGLQKLQQVTSNLFGS